MVYRRIRVWALVFLTGFVLISELAGEGSAEASASSTGHGKYLVGQGIVIPPGDVHVDSYIASVDYSYPFPEEGIGLSVYSGHRQTSSSGQDELIQIGVQGGKMDYGDLPPMNIAFVIDKSGSMDSDDKMDWVKESFYVFVENVRDVDFISLVVFDNSARVIFPSTRMDSRTKRLKFKNAVKEISPGGGTNLSDGLEHGYEQVMSNYRSEYTNRVLFLTDGVGEPGGILDMAAVYREMGVNVSTIGLGRDFDLQLMSELARVGGGSSRFVADREEMEKIFGTELDRAFVPVAREIKIDLDLVPGVAFVETWGYAHERNGSRISYRLPTLHHGDYETILARIRIDSGWSPGTRSLGTVTLNAVDLEGHSMESQVMQLTTEIVDSVNPVSGYSDAMVLRSGTTLDFAERLVLIGDLYYSCREEIDRMNRLRDDLWSGGSQSDWDSISNPEIDRLERSVSSSMSRAFDLAVAMKKEMENARLRLDSAGFEDELEIMEQYIQILGRELEMEEARVSGYVRDIEITPVVSDRSLTDHIDNLFREMTLDLRTRRGGVLAVSGFTMKDQSEPEILNLLNETATTEFGRIDTLTMVERARLDEVLAEQQLQLSGLVDTATAIRVGELLAAEYIVTGTVIEMAASVVIFGRVINVESAEVESVAQIIVPKDRDVLRLLNS